MKDYIKVASWVSLFFAIIFIYIFPFTHDFDDALKIGFGHCLKVWYGGALWLFVFGFVWSLFMNFMWWLGDKAFGK